MNDVVLGTLNLHIASFIQDVRQWVEEERLASGPPSTHEAQLFVLCSSAIATYNQSLALGKGLIYRRPQRPRRSTPSAQVPILRCSVSRIADGLVGLLSMPANSVAESQAWLEAELSRQRPQILCCMYDTIRDQACGAQAFITGPTYVYCQHHAGLYKPTTPAIVEQDWSDELF